MYKDASTDAWEVCHGGILRVWDHRCMAPHQPFATPLAVNYATIALSVYDGVAELTLNRPETLNALTLQMVDELRDAVDHVGKDRAIRTLLLTGAGRGFSSGADLGGAVDVKPIDAGECLETHFNPLLEELFALAKPLVVAVNGPAAGAGSSLAMVGDIVLASRSAYFVQAFVNIGLVPDAGATWLLPRQVGRARATALMMLGEKLPAETAAEWGLIYKVEEDAMLLSSARTIARKLASGPTQAYALLRHAIHAGLQGSLPESLALERANQRIAGFTADGEEGIRAFVEKRSPVFRGL